jgi:competence protein ComEA
MGSKIFKIISAISLTVIVLSLFAVAASAEEKKLTGKTVNINTATVEELATVPLISKELAEKIVKYREEVGDFQVLEELLQVEGFDRGLLQKIKTFLLLEGVGGDACTC